MDRHCPSDPAFEKLERLLRDDLGDRVRLEIQAHVESCPTCTAERQAILADQRLLAAAVAEPPTIHAARAHELVGASRRAPRSWGLVAAATAIIAVAAIGAAYSLVPQPSMHEGLVRRRSVFGRGSSRPYRISGSEVQFGEDFDADIEESRTGVRIELVKGEVECQVRPQGRGETFVVATDDLEVVVHGTRFIVRVGHPRSEVTVLEGRVEVRRRGEVPVFLEPTPVAARPAAAAEAPNAPPSEPATARHVSVPAADLLPDARRALAARDYEGAKAILARHLAGHAPDVDARYLLGEAQRLGGDPDAATRTFEALATGGGRVAENALARLAFLAERRGPEAAIAAWDRYLAAHPRGTVAAEGTIRRANTLFALGRRAEARAALERFLVDFPDHPRRAEVEARLHATP